MTIAGLLITANLAHAAQMTQDKQNNISPQQSLEQLMQGNKRFVKQKTMDHDVIELRQSTSKLGQFPHSLVFNCIDSRSDANMVFDQGIGNIFTSSIAGNVVSTDVIAGMEYAAQVAGSKLILILGHTRCGAVQAACKNTGSGNIKKLTAKIMPAVKAVGRKDCDSYEQVDRIAKQNVLVQIQDVLKASPSIKKLAADKKIRIIGGMHQLKTGKIEYFDMNGKAIEKPEAL